MKAILAKTIVLTGLTILLSCGDMIPSPPDFLGRAKDIQKIVFGRVILPDSQLLAAHASPDERDITWLYRINTEQRAQLFNRCIRAAEATDPFRPFGAGPRRTVPGCVIWEGRNNHTKLIVLVSEGTLEFRETKRD